MAVGGSATAYKKVYVGVNNTARLVKKIYIGVNNVARKVKKGYIGVNGVARLFFGGRELVKYTGTSISLTTAKAGINTDSITFNNRVLFGGGCIATSGTATTNVDGFNSSLSKTTYTLGAARAYGAMSCNSSYAFFGGGTNSSGTAQTTVYAWDTSMTRSTATALTGARWLLGHAEIGSYAIFAGGYGSDVIATAYAYNTSKTKSTVTSLGTAREHLGGAHVGSYAIFGGGWLSGGSNTDTVDVYNSSLSKITSGYSNLAQGGQTRGVSTSKYAVFICFNGNYISYYNSSLTRQSLSNLGISQSNWGYTVLDDFIIIGGSESSASSSLVWCFDESFTKSSAPSLSTGRQQLFAGTIGNYALFAGGKPTSSTFSTAIDIYKIQE